MATEELKPHTCQHRLFVQADQSRNLKIQVLKLARDATVTGKQPAPSLGQPLVSVQSPACSKGGSAPSLCTSTCGSSTSVVNINWDLIIISPAVGQGGKVGVSLQG